MMIATNMLIVTNKMSDTNMLSAYYLKAKASCRRPQKLKIMKNMKIYKNENGQKHIILVNLGLREYQNRIQHVHKSVHAKYELCSCQERRVMTILRAPGAKIQEQIGFVAARSCQGLPGASSYDDFTPSGGQESKKKWYLRIHGRMHFFRFFIVFLVLKKVLATFCRSDKFKSLYTVYVSTSF